MSLEERIRECAHRIWEEEGRPHGHEREHWERARREIEATASRTGRAGMGSPAEGTPVGVPNLVGTDEPDTGTPDAMGVDDLNVSGRVSSPADNRPATGRSKLVGT